ncbi:uncharacterized protein EI90DRAFT_3144156 [Cantharellus anzutake]|uniref:uncharacterized protein n=1 Tax=Cantharellus anzutake TaxID=1750568 RepID=UPI0019055921|nr:uncharacterized protein EI90DRAFT_3144156 [Cantharellus anzutake]KAF8338732.1 hypothetical protein EI90DRAFT_3144156 [Cantharellus anzutake]
MSVTRSSTGPRYLPLNVDSDGAYLFFGGDCKIKFVSKPGEPFKARQWLKADSPYTGAGKKSLANPPLHYHLYQTELFQVVSGVMGFVLDGEEGKLHPGQRVVIEPYQVHTFWNDPDSGEDLVVEVSLKGGDRRGLDETFLKNFFGYLDAQIMAGKTPDTLQMFTFMDSADVVIADVPLGLGRVANVVIGRAIAPWILGYKTSIPEFEQS